MGVLGLANKLRRTGKSKGDRERGFYLVIVALLIPVFMGFLGMAIDISHYHWAQSQLQNAADAAAFAGAKDLNSTAVGRTRATAAASSYARQHKVDGILVTPEDVAEDLTGRWNFTSNSFSATNIPDATANAVRVTVRRQNVPTFFAHFFGNESTSTTLAASATAVAGGVRSATCAAPVVIATCVLSYDSAGKMICPTKLSFQNALQSVGLTHPDGSSPINGNNTHGYFVDALNDPNGCAHAASFGDTLYLQNGNDIQSSTIDAINSATHNGATPISFTLPVVDLSCGNSGPNYNQSAQVAGFLKMRIVGGRWTGAAPTEVNAACPGLEKKNICVVSDCSMLGGPTGGTINIAGQNVYLVR